MSQDSVDPLGALVPPDVLGDLEHIQHSFSGYQKKAFPSRTSAFFALELCGEAGELANLEKKEWRNPEARPDYHQFEQEAADVFISLINYCNSKNIPLQKAVQKKLEIIETRRRSGAMGPTAGIQS
jgi:NTP pyrophosphatase (non-canonical NTP hydrolase)